MTTGRINQGARESVLFGRAPRYFFRGDRRGSRVRGAGRDLTLCARKAGVRYSLLIARSAAHALALPPCRHFMAYTFCRGSMASLAFSCIQAFTSVASTVSRTALGGHGFVSLVRLTDARVSDWA